MSKDTVTITSFSIKKDTPIIELSKFKLWICKLFKIKPETYHYYQVSVEVKDLAGSYVGDSLLMPTNSVWWIYEIRNNTMIITNTRPQLYCDVRCGDVIRFSNSWIPGNGQPISI